MADLLDTLGASLTNLLAGTNTQQRESPAPGGGPSAQREGPKESKGEAPRRAIRPSMGSGLGGYGGHADSAVAFDDRAQVQKQLAELVEQVKQSRAKDALRSRFRFNLPYSAEAHNQDGWRFVCGPLTLFDGTLGAAGGANVLQQVTIALPAGTVSPTLLLDRYPGAMYVNLFVRSFAICATATGQTGLQECFFTDSGGAVVPLGIYNTAVLNSGLQAIQALCSTPLTDPGLQTLGTLNVQNIGAATPVSQRWQLGISYAFMVPDPWFQAQQGYAPTPAERRAIEALSVGGARSSS